jgi:hypothetical protein
LVLLVPLLLLVLRPRPVQPQELPLVLVLLPEQPVVLRPVLPVEVQPEEELPVVLHVVEMGVEYRQERLPVVLRAQVLEELHKLALRLLSL